MRTSVGNNATSSCKVFHPIRCRETVVTTGVGFVAIGERESSTQRWQPETPSSFTNLRLPVPFDEQREVWQGEITSSQPDASWKDRRWVATLHYRGHRFESPFDWIPNRGNLSRGHRTQTGSATVSVEDGRPRRRSRTFILDCSASMFEPQEMEVTPNGPSPHKLDAARLALLQILERLQGTPIQSRSSSMDTVSRLVHHHNMRRCINNAIMQSILFQPR